MRSTSSGVAEKENNQGGRRGLRLRQGQAHGRRGLLLCWLSARSKSRPHLPPGSFLHLPLSLVVFEYEYETKLLPKESIYSVF